MVFLVRVSTLLCLFALFTSLAVADESKSTVVDESKKDTRPGIAPDIREDESKLKKQRGNFVAVPIPFSNPTLESGLVVGAAYFYKQTEEQKKVQPASVTGGGGLYTSNGSKAIALGHQNYWKNNTWRVTGAIGAADLRLSLLAPDVLDRGNRLDWRIEGEFLFAKLSRKLVGHWYGGFNLRAIDADQTFELSTESGSFDLGSHIRSIGLGASVEFDARDMPMNTYTGRYFKVDGLFNDEAIGSDNTYQAYTLTFRSYHKLTDSLILAWEMRGCTKHGNVPLWDACTVQLRGFSMTDYLASQTASGQAEARWHLSKRWGLVGFAGAGLVGNSFSGIRDHDPIPSYGVGVRFSVLPAKRINLRIDFARSKDDDAIHVAVGEAF